MSGPALLIHGGAGRQEGSHAGRQRYAERLDTILARCWPALVAGGAREAVLVAVRALEDDPLFNAGLGSKLQADGVIRMSAALMDGHNGRFSGVINVERIRHPIDLADALSGDLHTVVAGEQAGRLARSLGMVDFDPATPHRLGEHARGQRGEWGTVGAVALDAGGRLVAGTSTGGIGYELPGRVSDSATVAGTYAGTAAAVSCTGVGEQIVNHAAAARVVVRVEDGGELGTAAAATLREAAGRGYHYGLIAVDAGGRMFAGQTPGTVTLWAGRDPAGARNFLDPEESNARRAPA